MTSIVGVWLPQPKNTTQNNNISINPNADDNV
jgi:hypothetical protein